MNKMNSKYLIRLVYSLVAISWLGGCAVNERIIMSGNRYVATEPLKFISEQNNDGAIYQGQASSFIFEDMKARRVGDILTIVLSEKTNAKKQASTSTKKDNTVDLGTPTVFGSPITFKGRNILGANIGTAQEFSGEGDSVQSNALDGVISVTVASVYPNGNLFVKGQKRILLNQGDEYIQISGIVRPRDIGLDNTVSSTLLADARIIYSGEGAISDSNRMGWLARFFNGRYWPF